jgi:hypothetical protein
MKKSSAFPLQKPHLLRANPFFRATPPLHKEEPPCSYATPSPPPHPVTIPARRRRPNPAAHPTPDFPKLPKTPHPRKSAKTNRPAYHPFVASCLCRFVARPHFPFPPGFSFSVNTRS